MSPEEKEEIKAIILEFLRSPGVKEAMRENRERQHRRRIL